jgi:hypothetical protein
MAGVGSRGAFLCLDARTSRIRSPLIFDAAAQLMLDTIHSHFAMYAASSVW